MWSSSLTIAAGALVITAVGIHGCSAASDSSNLPSLVGAGVTSSSPEPFTRLLSATTSGFSEAAELVLRDESAFADAWRTVHNGIPGNPPPAVNFAQKMVIMLALGQRNTGGFAIRFDSITVDASGPVVRYTATSPGANCMTTQSLTSPIDAVVVPRHDAQVRFETRTVVQGC